MGRGFWQAAAPWGAALLREAAALAALLGAGWLLFRLCRPFVPVKEKRRWRLLLFLTFCGTSAMVIWVGDPNLLYTLPVFLALFFLCTRGDRVGRLAVAAIFFSFIMSVNALVDTYVGELLLHAPFGDLAARLVRPALIGLVYLFLWRRLPGEPVRLSRRLWKLVLGLAAMPLCSLAAVVLLTYQRYDSGLVYSLSTRLGLAVLPVVLVTTVALLLAILVLNKHEEMEKQGRLASLREVYYQGMRQREEQVRQLRHDLRNHLAAAYGLLESGDPEGAKAYLGKLTGHAGLQGVRRYGPNEMVNVVLSAKAEELERAGLRPEFAVSLPERLFVSDVDLCALLGNALDNAREGAQGCAGAKVRLRCRLDKGLLMLRVENPVAGPVPDDLTTTKPDRDAHGFGIPGMREIARRYGGTLEAGAEQGKFQLLVCLPEPEK